MTSIPNTSGIISDVVNATEPLVVDLADSKLATVKGSLAPELAPFVDEYGPTIVQWSADKIKAFVLSLSGPDTTAVAAYKALIAEMDTNGLLGELAKLHASFLEANAANTAQIASDKSTIDGILIALLKIGVAALAAA